MTNRISERFAKVNAEGRAALIPFIMGGDPGMEACEAILNELPDAGADIIEIGAPFSDPMADGTVIQQAGLRALKAGATLSGILDMIARFRKYDAKTPIVLMGYYNPIYRMGVDAFCARAAEAGVDGVILVDLPPEEEEEFTSEAKASGLAFIRLIAPTSGEARARQLLSTASGFVYCIAIAGITGAKGAEGTAVKEMVSAIKQHATLPVAVGFGIKTPEQAKEVGAFADAVVVGSALVDVIARSKGNAAEAVRFVGELSRALDSSSFRRRPE